MDTTVVYTTPMSSSSMFHRGANGHCEVIVTIKKPNCRCVDSVLISAIFNLRLDIHIIHSSLVDYLAQRGVHLHSDFEMSSSKNLVGRPGFFVYFKLDFCRLHRQ